MGGQGRAAHLLLQQVGRHLDSGMLRLGAGVAFSALTVEFGTRQQRGDSGSRAALARGWAALRALWIGVRARPAVRRSPQAAGI